MVLGFGVGTIYEADPLEFRIYDGTMPPPAAPLITYTHIQGTNPTFIVDAPIDPAIGFIIESYDPIVIG